jgi:DNA-binding PadR family transcriptional regulator
MATDGIRLTSTSYVVLGMLDWLGPSTPYRLKRVLTDTVEDFFPVPHTSFYVEPARLAGAGYLDEEREEGSRRRRVYSLNPRGRAALEAWLAEPETAFGQFRFPGMLKLFFGADASAFALEQAEHHHALAAKFTSARERAAAGKIELSPGRALVLDTGIELHEWWTARWRHVAEQAAARDQ